MRWSLTLSCTVITIFASSVHAAVFMADTFSYADGQLTDSDTGGAGGAGDNVGGGKWNAHSGASTSGEWVDVIGGQAELLIDGSEDVNQELGTTMGAGDTWYFATTVTVDDFRNDPESDFLDNEYFIHFMAGSFNLRTRVYVDAPNAASDSNFAFGLSSSSGGQNIAWATDFAFGSTHTIVGSYDFDTGNSEMWIDPVDVNSTSITDPTPNANSPSQPINALGLRQASNSNRPSHQVLVDAVSTGDSFADVLAALGTDVDPTAAVDVDLDNDGDVDGADFLAIQRTNGSLIPDWETQFGTTAASLSISAVPEPSSIGLLGLAMGLALSRRRPRR